MKRFTAVHRLPFGYFGLGSLVILFSFLFSIVGCDLGETVYVERPFYTDPPEEALGFLGYDEEDENFTVCGNCHVDPQSTWKQTAHAGAWEGLQDSGHAADYCEDCHTVGQLGNPASNASGWGTTKDSRYHDVQCESCHGAGQAHVNNPGASQPIAGMDLGDLSDLGAAKNCAECHQGTHHPFAEDWKESKHASVVSYAAGRADCEGCHRGQGALKAWGVNTRYLEQESTDHLAITCAVCHDPHDATYEGQLRRPVKTASVEQHLCASCHNRRTVPDPNSRQGLKPHSPQTALLVGEAGWFPPNANIDVGQILGTHGSVVNEKICATCHVNSFTVTDAATGNFQYSATGHLFTASPCLDETGKPKTGDCEINPTARSFAGCTGAGCHGSQQAAASAMTSSVDVIKLLADDLYDLLERADPNLDSAGGEIDANDPTFTVAEGAYFNYNLAKFGGKYNGSAVHNPFLIRALLVASIDAVMAQYNLTGSNPRSYYKEELRKLVSGLPKVQPLASAQSFGSGTLSPVRSH